MQCRQPVTFSSRALTPAERRYSQIEKELLPHVFGMEHNHNYVYGRKVILWTDHKLLVSISKKLLVSVPKRLQHLLLRLQHNDYEICYKPGKDMERADTLSRAYLTEYERSAPEAEVEHIHATHFLPVPEHQLKELQKERACDQTLQTLNKALVDGFPDTKHALLAAIHLYFQLPYELSIHDGIIFKGLRCVIPQTLQPRIKAKLHESHIGVQGCSKRVRETIYWPGMNAEIIDFIQTCDTRMAYQSNQPKEPLICHEVPTTPWKK